MELHELINKFIEKKGYKNYLEVGFRAGYTISRVKFTHGETREQRSGSWTGDVWKGFLQTVLYRDDVNYYTIPDCKAGVGVIYFEDCPIKDKLDFQTYREYGRKLLKVRYNY